MYQNWNSIFDHGNCCTDCIKRLAFPVFLPCRSQSHFFFTYGKHFSLFNTVHTTHHAQNMNIPKKINKRKAAMNFKSWDFCHFFGRFLLVGRSVGPFERFEMNGMDRVCSARGHFMSTQNSLHINGLFLFYSIPHNFFFCYCEVCICNDACGHLLITFEVENVFSTRTWLKKN